MKWNSFWNDLNHLLSDLKYNRHQLIIKQNWKNIDFMLFKSCIILLALIIETKISSYQGSLHRSSAQSVWVQDSESEIFKFDPKSIDYMIDGFGLWIPVSYIK